MRRRRMRWAWKALKQINVLIFDVNDDCTDVETENV